MNRTQRRGTVQYVQDKIESASHWIMYYIKGLQAMFVTNIKQRSTVKEICKRWGYYGIFCGLWQI